MTLLLTGTREEALLALVIKHAAEVANEHNTYVGRTAIQKVMYYLKTRGVEMAYRFDIYHYGPYCQDIVNDIEWLLADNVIADKSNRPETYSNYAPSSAIGELLESNIESLKANEPVIREIVGTFVPLSPNLLELIATLDYLYRAEIAKGAQADMKRTVVDRFVGFKKDKYERSLVEDMYDVVVRTSGAAGHLAEAKATVAGASSGT